MKPLVSIIIPTYNRGKELKRALESIYCQTYSNWEVCIVDNHSDDNTIEMIESYNDLRLKIYKIHNNGVIGASRNAGIENANGKYVAFLDSDDWWTSEKLEVSISTLEEGVDLVYHDMLLATKINQKIFPRRAKTRRLDAPAFNDLLVGGNAIITSSVVVNKEILKKIKGFREEKTLVGIEDYDAWLRIAKTTDNFKRIHKAFGYYWSGGGNTSNPRRTIQIFDVFEREYKDEILKQNAHQSMYWFSYNKARAFYALGLKEKAIKSFKIALNQKPALLIKFKCMSMLLIIGIQIFLIKRKIPLCRNFF